jgi:DNA-binding response OmpR family regulator
LKILVVDDEHVALTSIRRLLKRRGIHDVQICDNGAEAVQRIRTEDFDIVLLDILMPQTDGIQVIEAARPFRPDVEFVVLTAVDDVSTAVQAIRLGAFDYIVKPADNERLFLSIERAYERRGLRAGLAGSSAGNTRGNIAEAFAEIITQNPRMIELLAFARIMARTGNPILITGESGTGKELLAKGIHRASPVAEGPFIAVNVSATNIDMDKAIKEGRFRLDLGLPPQIDPRPPAAPEGAQRRYPAAGRSFSICHARPGRRSCPYRLASPGCLVGPSRRCNVGRSVPGPWGSLRGAGRKRRPGALPGRSGCPG